MTDYNAVGGLDRTALALDTAVNTPTQQFKVEKTTADILGSDVKYVRERKAEAQRMARLRELDLQALKEHSPKTNKWLSVADNAAIAHDDVENLSAFEQVTKALGASVDRTQAGLQNDAADVLEFSNYALSPLIDMPHNISDKLRVDARKNNEQVAAAHKGRENLPYLGKMALGGLESILPSLAAAGVTALTRSPTAGLASFALPTFGNEKQKGIDQGMSELDATLHGTAQGLLEGATEMLGVTKLLSAVKDKSSFVKTVGDFVGAQLYGEEINTLAGNFESWATLPENKDKSFMDYTEAQPSAMVDTFWQTLFGAGATGGIVHGTAKATQYGADKIATHLKKKADKIHKDMKDAGQAMQDKQALDRGVEIMTQESKLHKLSPEDAYRFAKEVVGDKTVSLKAEDAAIFFQENEDVLYSLRDTSPDAYAAYERSQLDGSDMTIPMDEYIANFNEYHAFLSDKLHINDNPMNAKDAEEHTISMKERLKVEADKVFEGATGEFAQSANEVRDTIAKKLEATGRFTQDTAQVNATLFSHMVASTAKEVGVLPHEFMQQFPLRVSNGGEISFINPTTQNATGFDELVYKVRSGRIPTDNEVHGQSLLEFLHSKGGLQDQGGELKARDFPKKYIKKQGNSLDGAAELAHEAGYIDERDINKLIESLDSELSGKPVYAPLDYNADLHDEQRALNEIQLAIGDKDISELSNADIRKLLYGDFLQSDVAQSIIRGLGNEEGLFKYNSSEAGDLETIVSDLSEGNDMTVVEDDSVMNADKSFRITMRAVKNGKDESKTASVTQNGKYVWIGAQSLKSGISRGSKLYHAVATYAYNNDLVFRGDPAGLSPKAHYRRLENMLSSAIRFGTTEHIEPHKKQLKGLNEGGWKLSPLKWKTDGSVTENTSANISAMLELSEEYVLKAIPAIDNMSFNFVSGRFVYEGNESTGSREVLQEVWANIAKSGRARQNGIGSSTLKRVVFLRSLRQGGGQHDWVAQFARFGGSSGLGDAGRIFYQGLIHKPKIPEYDLESKTSSEQLDLLEAAYPEQAALLSDRRNIVKMVKLKRLNKTGSMEAQEIKHELVDQIEVAKKKKDRAFTRWFGNSVVTDVKGEPKVVYHGTGANVSDSFIFDYSRIGEQGRAEGAGFYFTENKDIADSYGGKGSTLDVYLSIENPILYDQEGFDTGTVRDILSKMAQAEVDKYETGIGDGFLSNFGDVSYEGLDAVLDGAAESFTSMSALDQLSSMVGAGGDIELVNRAAYEVTGHDGVVTDGFSDQGGDKIYVAFFPEQIKSTKAIEYDKSNSDIFMQGNNSPRGFINFGEGVDIGENVITLLADSNLSTFIHESAHLFFELRTHLAGQAGASDALKSDMNALLAWGGIDSLEQWHTMSRDEQRNLHEQVARGFESYLKEGKAPTSELKGVFSRMRAWMVSVYRALKNLNVSLTPEVRSVFDRMVATDDALQAAKDEQNLSPLFETQEQSGMDDTDWKLHLKAIEDAKVDGESELSAKAIKDMKYLDNAKSKVMKSLQAEGKAARKAVMEEVSVEVMAERVNKLRVFLARGTVPNELKAHGVESMKIDTVALKEMYGTDPIRLKIPNNMKSSKGGTNPEVIAAWFGYESGDAMIRDMADSPKAKEVISEETDKRVLERYGDMYTPDQIEKAAMETVHASSMRKVIAQELKALDKIAGRKPILINQVRDYAYDIIARLNVNEAGKSSKYLRAERKAAKAAHEAIHKSDTGEAAKQKQAQLFQQYLYSESEKAAKETAKILRYVKKFNKKGSVKNIDAEYVDQLALILDKYDFNSSISLKEQGIKELAQKGDLHKWIASETEKVGMTPQIKDSVLNRATRLSYKHIPMEELRGVYDALKTIENFGRNKKSLMVLAKKEELNVAANDIAESLAENNELKEVDTFVTPTFKQAFNKKLGSMGASLISMEAVFRRLDGDKLGVLWTTLFKPLSDASDRAFSRKAEVAKEFRELVQSLYSKKERMLFSGVGAKRYSIKGFNESLTRENLVTITLYHGSETGRQRLSNDFNAVQLKQIFDLLEDKDIQLIEHIWQSFETHTWNDLRDLEREINGKAPEKVESMPFTVGDKQLKGGYLHIKYDPSRSERFEDIDETQKLEDMMGGKTGAALTTKQGAAKARVENVGYKLRYDLGVYGEGMNEILQDVEMRRAVIDAFRLMKHPSFISAFKSSAGAAIYNELRPWLTDIAVPPVADVGGLSRTMGMLRNHTAIVAMGMSIKTAFINITGYLQSFDANDVGVGRIAKHTALFFKNPLKMKAMQDEVFALSEYMTNRANTFDRDVQAHAREMSVKGTLTPKASTWFYLLALTDKAVAIPTWRAAYEAEMERNDNNQEKAIAFADHIVRSTQGGGREIDLSMIQRGNPGNRELYKASTMFYSFFNATLQRNIRNVDLLKRNGIKDIPRFIASVMFLNILPATIGAIIAGYGADDDENKWLWGAGEVAKFMVGQVPFVRDIAGYAIGKMDGEYFPYRITPLSSSLDMAVMYPYQIASDIIDGEADEKTLKEAVLSTGIYIGLPARQTWRITEHVMHVADGESDFSPIDLLMGEKYKPK